MKQIFVLRNVGENVWKAYFKAITGSKINEAAAYLIASKTGNFGDVRGNRSVKCHSENFESEHVTLRFREKNTDADK